MAVVRRFTCKDIPQVVSMNSRLFPESNRLSAEEQSKRFSEICLHNPWYEEDISSLVHVEDNGTISGFLAVVPRRMSFRGESLRVGVSQHLMADKSPFAGLRLFEAFLKGPQDFSMTDMAVDVARKLWERLGGTTSRLQSFYWTRPIRLGSFLAWQAERVKPLKPVVRLLRPVNGLFDRLLSLLPGNPYRIHPAEATSEPLSVEEFLTEIDRTSARYSLRPSYAKPTADWLFRLLGDEDRFGTFTKEVVRDGKGKTLGWYLYNAKRGGKGEVLQIGAVGSSMGLVFDQLVLSAYRQGVVHLSGRVDPLYMKEYGERGCLFSPGKAWMLVHSRRPEIVQAVLRGDAFLTRLEGDLWFL